MKALVLQGFLYSVDGVHVVALSAGQEADIRDGLVEGLKTAGYIGETDGAPAPRQPPQEALPPARGVENAPAALDPATADLEAVRAFLEQAGVKPHHKTGEAKLREMAADLLAKD